ncbi:hypothetical protein QLQ86_08830 [Halomonas sp. LR5S13]|uniref:hypothetical protein n=1 Tax=Halomonas rhizosphaerae TaxID=3043296 RepID=UPI0024A8D7C2|nr:hypothetical protein [Halomonas rhizosphaerae]MDI5920887.1 hypothetical protein [Halomonas rhizosphaerae]
MERIPATLVGLWVGGGVLISTLLIQLVVLGILLPDWGDGNGLIPGQDVVGFHSVAVEQAQAIAHHGWSAWEQRPNGWGISGLMSAWYAITLSEPWVLVPWQALMFGISAGLLASMLGSLSHHRGVTLLGTLPMLLLPSAAMVYAQPHRDIVVMFGLMLAIYGWGWLAKAQQVEWRRALGYSAGAVVLVGSGFVSAWMVRDFSAEIFQGLGAILALLLVCLAAVRLTRERRIRLGLILSPLLAVVMLLGMITFHAGNRFDRELAESSSQDIAVHEQTETETETESVWYASTWLPSMADDKLRRLSGAREHFLRGYSHGRSLVDEHVHYRSVGDMLAYTPRALQIGLLSPFPYQWVPHPEAPAVRNAYRVLAGMEMFLLYLILPFLGYAIWRWWRRDTLWLLLMPALAWVMVYSYTVPVVGALVRYRFPGYIILVALAVAGLCQAIRDGWARRAGISVAPSSKEN